MKPFKSTLLNNFLYILLLVVITFSIYYQSTGFEFVLDDKIVISENSFVKNGVDGIWDILSTDSFTGYFGEQQNLLEGGRYRPLSLVFFSIEYELFGLTPHYFHLFNILYYSILSILIYLFLVILFRTKITNKSLLLLLSFTGALIFIIHPIHTEVVANIKGRDEILSLLFSVLGAILIFNYHDKNKIWILVSALASMFLAFLSKENSLAFVFIIPLSLYFFRKTQIKSLSKITLLLLIPAIIFFVIRYQALGFIFNTDVQQTGIMNNPFIGTDLGQKLATISYTLLIYIKLIFYPHPLTHDYYPYHIPIIEFTSISGILSILSLLLLLAYSVYSIRKRNIFSYLILFFLSSIFMMSNLLFNVGTFMNERFIFMASVLLPILLIWLASYLLSNHKPLGKYLFTSIIVLILSGFTYKSIDRIPAWENTESLNRAAVKVSVNSARANCFMGVWLYEEMVKTEDSEAKTLLINEASEYITKSLEIYPEYKDALTMKAGIATERYKVDKNLDKLLDQFYQILSVRHISFVDEYLEWLVPRTLANKIVPFLYKVGYKLKAKENNDLSKAEFYLNLGINKDRSSRNILFGITIVKYLSQKYSDAINYGNQFIEIDDSNAEMYYYVGLSYNFNGEYEKGSQYLDKSYGLKPELRGK